MRLLDKLFRKIPYITRPRKLKMPDLSFVDKITCTLPERTQYELDYETSDKKTVTVFVAETKEYRELTNKVDINKLIETIPDLKRGWYRHIFTQPDYSQVILNFFQGDKKVLRLGLKATSLEYRGKGKAYYKDLHENPNRIKDILSFFDLEVDVLRIWSTRYKDRI
jgi:hypothetical protein